MPAILYGKGAYRRDRGALPEFTLVNMFLEATPSAENGVVLLSRQGLEVDRTVGNGPVRGSFSQPGTFGGDVFTVSGSGLYRGTTLIAVIAGNGPVFFAGSSSEVLVTSGTTLYSYNGTDVATVALPDSFNARAITFISGHFIAVRDGSQKFYWSAQLNGRSWDALDFASAESEPDNLLDAIAVRGNLYLLGEASVEPWDYTGALDLPFSLIEQWIFPKGIHSTGCAVEMDNGIFWVASDGMVYRNGDVPERLSDHGIEERIGDSATVSAFGFIHEGHSFFCVRLDTQTFAYDAATGQWCELQTYGRTNFAARCAVMVDQTVLFGDDTLGTLWRFGDTYADGDSELVREFTGAFPIKGGIVTVDNLTVDASVGHTPDLSGQGEDPILEVASSYDAGTTWQNFRQAKLGRQGHYRHRARLTRLGTFDSVGGMFKFRVTDPVGVRVSNVLVNEAGGGRSR